MGQDRPTGQSAGTNQIPVGVLLARHRTAEPTAGAIIREEQHIAADQQCAELVSPRDNDDISWNTLPPRAIASPTATTPLSTKLLSSTRNASAPTTIIPKYPDIPEREPGRALSLPAESGCRVVKRRGVETPIALGTGRALARRIRERSTLRYSALRSARMAVFTGGFVAVGITLGMLASGLMPGGQNLLERFDLISVAEQAPGGQTTGPRTDTPEPSIRPTPTDALTPSLPGEFPVNGEITIPTSIVPVTPLPNFPPPPSWWNCSGRCVAG